MFHSERIRMLLPALLLAAGRLWADDVILSGDGRLSGTVRSISGEGVVSLESPLADQPVLLKGQGVERIVFSEPQGGSHIPSARVELANGDAIPVEVESLDEKELAVASPVAGKLRIPRSALKSLVLGIHPSIPVYEGPVADDDFQPDGPQGENWSYEDGIFMIEGQGRISRKMDPLPQFIVRFVLEWRNNPSFQFYFADPLLPSGERADRYCFQFTPAGLLINRETAAGKPLVPFVTLDRRPEHFTGNRLKVELRLDRSQSLLYLFLNDEPEGRYIDPVPGPPQGGGIAMASASGNETTTRVSEIAVLRRDHEGDRHRTEDRGDQKADSLIGRRGDRFGGSLISIRPDAGGPVFSFKSSFQDSPIELPESEVSTIFFRQGDAPREEKAKPFVLRLRGDGVMQVSSCTFPGDRIEVTHPLLGGLSFSRDGVTALERGAEKGGVP